MGTCRILAFAREAGGGAAIAPVLRELQKETQVLVLAKDYAADVFREAGLSPVPFPEFSEGALAQAAARHLGSAMPEVIFTSASSLPQHDMTERYLWRWARDKGIPSVAVVDQWQNYALRFSGIGPDRHLRYLPDWIAAMDDHARRGMVADGVPEDRIVVTGQPAFDGLAKVRESYGPDERAALRRAIGVAPGAVLVCFVAENFARDFGETLGYTERSVLRDVLWVCERLQGEGDGPLHLAVKLHPKNAPDDFRWVAGSAPPGLRVTVHWKEQPPIPLVMASDVVVGMTSVLMVESILVGRPTVSLQPGARQPDGLIATVVGAIPRLEDRAACLRTLRGLLRDPDFRAGYLARQSRLRVDGRAAQRAAALVRRAAAQVAAAP